MITPVLAIFDVGGPEFLVILVLVLLLFGGKRMPELARGVGKAIRDFKRATAGVEDQLKRALEEEPAAAKPASQIADSATTTPEDTSVYDKAAASAGAAASSAATSADAPATGEDSADDQTKTDAPQEGSAQSASTEDYEDVDPYADEYIGGTARSDAAAHGIDADDVGEGAGDVSDAQSQSPSESGQAEPGGEKKNVKPSASDSGASAGAGDGGGI